MIGSFSVVPKRGCGHRKGVSALYLIILLLGLSACDTKDPLGQLIEQLDEPATREQAIDALIKAISQAPPKKRPAVQARVVDALCEAYRTDKDRGEIIGTLAFLKAPQAKHVFIAALRDADRGGKYREAAIRAAQIIGELKLTAETPELLDALKKVRKKPPAEKGNWLERAIINALILLGDQRAIPGLIEILKDPPDKQDLYLSKLAAQALGQLADQRGIAPLIDSLTRGAYGLLLYETNRRSLCMIGPTATKTLLARVTERNHGSQQYSTAIAAVKILGDLGYTGPTSSLQLTKQDNAKYRLAIAESLLRLADQRGATILIAMIQDETLPLTVRKQAVDLLGWYGSTGSVDALLTKICAQDSPAQNVLCWGSALAHTRLAGGEGLAALDQLIATRTDRATLNYLQGYRVRLVMMEQCSMEPACLEKQLSANDWRVQERAALALGRQAGELPQAERSKIGERLVQVYQDAHPQVQEAILIGLERLDFAPETRAKMAAQLLSAKASSDPAIESRTLCLSYRMSRTPGEKNDPN